MPVWITARPALLPALALLPLGLTACDRHEPAPPPPPGPDPIVEAADPELDQAVLDARRNVYLLLAALSGATDRPRAVTVKVAVRDGEVVETLPLTDVQVRDGNLVGRIDDTPIRVQNVQQGQEYSVPPHEVVDWFFIRGDQMTGGYTFRVLRARLDAPKRADLDAALGVTFPDDTAPTDAPATPAIEAPPATP